VWGDSSVGVRTPHGMIYGHTIQWDRIVPAQVVWAPLSAGAASSTTILDLSLREP